jgi:hypothetical protein
LHERLGGRIMAGESSGIRLVIRGPERRGSMAMKIRLYADEIRPGDIIMYEGRHHRITGVPRRAGWAWPVATDGTGWAIALDHRLITASRH